MITLPRRSGELYHPQCRCALVSTHQFGVLEERGGFIVTWQAQDNHTFCCGVERQWKAKREQVLTPFPYLLSANWYISEWML